MKFKTKVGSIELRNPLILSSGVLGSSYSSLEKMYNDGMGAVITKSIGPRSREGNPNPSVFALSNIRSMVNSVGLANPGYKEYSHDLEKLMKKNVPTIVSIFGSNLEEFSEVLEGMKNMPTLGFELNLSCPNTEKEGMSLGTDPDIVYEITSELRKRTKKPLWIKLTPNVTDMIEIAEAGVKGGCDAIVAINTLKAMVIDIHTAKPVLGFKRGGLSGSAIKPVGVRYVYDLYERFKDQVPIIGVGGITDYKDVIEYILAGAQAVEIGTALGVAYPGNKIRLWLQKIGQFLEEREMKSIEELVGGAHE